MPDIINPHRTGFIRLRLRVNTCLFQSRLEDRVREAEISSNSMVEGIVASRFITMAPSELPGIKSQDAGRESRVMSTLQETEGKARRRAACRAGKTGLLPRSLF